MTLIRLCIIAGCVPPTPVPIPPQSCGLGPCPHGYLGPTHMGTPVKHAVHHPCIPRCEAVGHFGTFTLPRRHPLGLERHPQDPGPSGDFAWLLLTQSQRGSLLFPGLPPDPTPPHPRHSQPLSPGSPHALSPWVTAPLCLPSPTPPVPTTLPLRSSQTPDPYLSKEGCPTSTSQAK